MRVGDVVRFVEPLTEAERGERFRVVEVRGERVLVEMDAAQCGGWRIVPTFVYLAADLITDG